MACYGPAAANASACPGNSQRGPAATGRREPPPQEHRYRGGRQWHFPAEAQQPAGMGVHGGKGVSQART